MPDYRCNRVPGGTYFFTVNLLERRGHLLVEHLDAFREAVRRVIDRPHSSFHQLVRAGTYPPDWAGVDAPELAAGERGPQESIRRKALRFSALVLSFHQAGGVVLVARRKAGIVL